MMETRIHSRAADTAMLLDDGKLSAMASSTPEDGAASEPVDFAATLQDLIASDRQAGSLSGGDTRSAADSRWEDESPRTSGADATIPIPGRPSDAAWAAVLSDDGARTA